MPLDAGLSLLNEYGYNLTQRQDVRLAPLDVLGRDDVLERLGSVTTLFQSTARVPVPAAPAPAGAFEGQQSGNVHISLAGRLLLHMLNGLGSRVGIDQLKAFGGSIRYIRFEFAAVENVGLDPIAVGSYLASAEPRTTPVVDRYLRNPDADAFVVTDVMRAGTVRILPLEIGNAPVPVDLSRLQAAFGDAVEVGMRNDWIECRSSTKATMAFKCYRIQRTARAWALSGFEASNGSTRPSLIAPGTRVLVRQGPDAAGPSS